MRLWKVLLLASLVTFSQAQIVNHSESIIKDTKSNFLWQDDKIVKTEKRSFNDAIDYCKNLEIDNITGWQLPGFLELFSIVNTKSYNPTLSKKFKNFVSDNYWSSKKFGHGSSTEAFVVNFQSGAFNRELMNEKFYVRCYKKLDK